MSNHFPERKLKPGDRNDKTRVVWTRNDPHSAVIFVHGYRGAPIATWTQFESLLTLEPKAANYDLFFFGWEGYSGDTTTAGRLLCDLLNEVGTDPSALLSGSRRAATNRPAGYQYQNLV